MNKSADMFDESPQQTVVAPGQRVTFNFPWPPSVNSYWGHRAPRAGLVIAYKTKKADEYTEAVRAIVLQRYGRFPEPISGDVILDMVLHAPDNRVRDADNYNKGVWDSMKQAKLFVDDRLVWSYRVTKGAVVRGGLVVVQLWERSSAQAQG